jgi:hypothetical protein
MKVSYMIFWSFLSAIYVGITFYTANSYNRVADSIDNIVECRNEI